MAARRSDRQPAATTAAVTPKRFRGAHFWFAGIWKEDRPARLGPREPADFDTLADLCDSAAGPSREIDTRIALAISPQLRLLARLATGVWAHPDGSRVRAPSYSSSTAAALTLVPDGHWIECNPRAAGRIEIRGPGGEREVGWGRNSHFPLAASAAALRAIARLPKRGADRQIPRIGAGAVTAPEASW